MDRQRLLRAICIGTQNTSYRCNDTCKSLCDVAGGCVYCSYIADAIEDEFKKELNN